MKKNAGFMLFEALVVSSLVLGTLVFLYVQITSIKKSYSKSFRYDTIEGLYKADLISNYLEKTGYSDILTQLGDNTYLDITDCVYADGSLCSKLVSESNVKQMLFVNQNITQLKNQLSTLTINKDFKKYIMHMDSIKKGYNYRLIIAYNDNTYASVGVGIDLSELNEYTLTNEIINSGFETNTTNWTITGTTNTASINTAFKKSGNSSLSFKTSSESENKISQTVTLKANHIYYSGFYIYLDKNENGLTNIYLDTNNEYANVQFSTLRSRKWNYVSSTFKATTAGNYAYNIATLTSINNTYLDNVMLVDLTESFGEGNEPDLEWCDSHITYFDTTKTLYK